MPPTAAKAKNGAQRYLVASAPLPTASTSAPRSFDARPTRYPVYKPEPAPKSSRSEDKSHKRPLKPTMSRRSIDKSITVSERTPLLNGASGPNRDGLNVASTPQPAVKKPFYRARPLWLVPFAIVAALLRGMTLAPRVEVYTQLSCYALHGQHEYNQTVILPDLPPESIDWDTSSAISLYSSLDPLGPYLFTHPSFDTNNAHRLPTLPGPIDPLLSSDYNRTISDVDGDEDDGLHPDPRRLPTARCLSDPAVQANAARLQTILTTTMGLLSALTTGWWGHFGERYGRTKVLAVATFGLFWADLIFILTSTPNLPWPLTWFSYTAKGNHAQHLLLLAPLGEGLLGGWSTLQSATSAYLSDCTSPGSRAHLFSRFTGVFYLGFSAGPAIAAWLIRHPNLFRFPSSSDSPAPGPTFVDLNGKTTAQRESVAAVFWIAVVCSFINFLLVLFVFPESLTKEKRDQAKQAYQAKHSPAIHPGAEPTKSSRQDKLDFPVTGVEDVEGVGIGAIHDVDEITSPVVEAREHFSPWTSKGNVDTPAGRESSSGIAQSDNASDGIFMRFLRPLTIFLPVYVDMPTRNGLTVKRRKDYSLTFLAGALFAWMLSTGVYQIKYLYAGHTYRWGAEKLSYYISFMGGARASFLLVILPFLISTFKSKPKPQVESPGSRNGKGKARADHDHQDDDADVEANDNDKGKKPAPTRLELGKAIRFDLRLSRCSLMIDILANILVATSPSPSIRPHGALDRPEPPQGSPTWSMTRDQSERLFVLASGLNAFASGMVPSVHSLALCITQARTLDADFGLPGGHSSEGHRDQSLSATAAPVDTGTLFGAFAILQAVGQMIMGPMLFGIVYSGTVASHPKAIFGVAIGLLVFAITLVMFVKNPVGEVRLARKDKKFRRRMEEGHGAFGMTYAGPNGTGYRYVGGGKRKGKGRNWEQEIERRGRTRNSKDLRGGAVPWYCYPDDEESGGEGERRHLVTRSA